MEKSKVSIQFPLILRQSGDVLFFLYARRLRGYTATLPLFVKGHSHGQSFLCFHWALLLTNVPLRKHNCHDVANHMNCINS